MQALDPTVQYYIAAAAAEPSQYITWGPSTDATYLTSANNPYGAFPFSITTSVSNSSYNKKLCGNYTYLHCLSHFTSNDSYVFISASYSVLEKDPDRYAGQDWSLNGTLQADGTTYWRLQNDIGGPSRYLARQDDHVFLLDNAADNATYWQFVTSAPGHTSTSSTMTTTTATGLSTATRSSGAVSRKTSLGIGALVGIVVGPVAIALLVAIAFILQMS